MYFLRFWVKRVNSDRWNWFSFHLRKYELSILCVLNVLLLGLVWRWLRKCSDNFLNRVGNFYFWAWVWVWVWVTVWVWVRVYLLLKYSWLRCGHSQPTPRRIQFTLLCQVGTWLRQTVDIAAKCWLSYWLMRAPSPARARVEPHFLACACGIARGAGERLMLGWR